MSDSGIIEIERDKMTIEEMAKAHLENVKKALNDLLIQRERINQEIEKINQYLVEGQSLVLSNENVNQVSNEE